MIKVQKLVEDMSFLSIVVTKILEAISLLPGPPISYSFLFL